MSSSPDTAPCKEHLPDVYRFAFLMTGHGDAAAEVLRRTVERAARGGIGDLRDPRRVRRWLFAEARQHCGDPLPSGPLPPVPAANGHGDPAPIPAGADPLPLTPGPSHSPVDGLAAAFGALPERERSALILFYLYLFSPADLAETLELPPDALGPVLSHGRALLTRELEKSSPASGEERPAEPPEAALASAPRTREQPLEAESPQPEADV